MTLSFFYVSNSTTFSENSYEISEVDGLPTGTKITLHLKAGDAAEYGDEAKIKEVRI